MQLLVKHRDLFHSPNLKISFYETMAINIRNIYTEFVEFRQKQNLIENQFEMVHVLNVPLHTLHTKTKPPTKTAPYCGYSLSLHATYSNR